MMEKTVDIEEVLRRLKQRFKLPLQDFYKRRIIFWKDEKRQFADKLEGIEIPDVELIVLTEHNNFAVKKTLAVDESTKNFLIYCPITYENDEDNWLLDMELYSEEFRADLTAIWLEELGLSESLRKEVERFSKFFNAKTRRDTFRDNCGQKTVNTPEQLQTVIMSSLCENAKNDPKLIIKQALLNGTDMEENPLYNEFKKYEIAESFWKMVFQKTGYSEENKSLEKLGAHIVLTASTKTLDSDILKGLDRFISTSQAHQAFCYELIDEWIHSDKKSEYINFVRLILGEKMKLYQRFTERKCTELVYTEVFPCIDKILLIKMMKNIIENDVISEKLINIIRKTIENRRNFSWYENFKDYYDGVLAFLNMQTFYNEHRNDFHIVEPNNIWHEYVSDYYRMDTYYRKFHLTVHKEGQKSYQSELHDLFIDIRDKKVENLYTHWFLEKLGENWTKACASDLENFGYIKEVEKQEDFYENKIRKANNRIYVIISDALRYDVAVSLTEELKKKSRSETNISNMQAIFPTITKFGMAALLPHKEITIEKTKNEDLKVLIDGQPTDSIYREKILQNANKESIVLKASDLMNMKGSLFEEKVKGKSVIYIYHDTIDEMGHNSENKIFAACQDTIEELKRLVDFISKNSSSCNIIITADHGFLYTYKELTEESKTEKTDFADRIIEIGRRYAILKKGSKPNYLIPVKLLDGNSDYEGYAPRENIRIKTNAGSGMNFVHGGISLQEMVVPLIEYKYFRSDSKKYQRNKDLIDMTPVEIGLVSDNRKISNRIFFLQFYQKEAVGKTHFKCIYNVYFENKDGEKICDTQRIIADKTDDNRQNRIFTCNFSLRSATYSDVESYFLIMEREKQEDDYENDIQRIEFHIDIAISVDDFGF